MELTNGTDKSYHPPTDKWYHPPTILTTRLNGNLDSTLNFTYTLDDLVKSIQQTGPNVTTKSIEYGYDNSARRTSLSRYSDLANQSSLFATQYVFRNASNVQTNRLQSLEHKSASTSFAKYQYLWDDANRLASVNSTTDGLTGYTYDSVNQLVNVTYSNNVGIWGHRTT